MAKEAAVDADTKEKLRLIYDGDCPVCRYYCEGLDVDSDAFELELIDFRKAGTPEANTYKNRVPEACDPDKNIIFKHGDRVYQGGDALHQLSKLSVHRRAFPRALARVFRSLRFSRYIYPVLRLARDVLVSLTRINK